MKITGVGLAVSSGETAIPWPLRESAVSRRYRPAASLAEMVRHALRECGARGPIVVASCNGKITTWNDDDWRTSFELAGLVDAEAAPAATERARQGRGTVVPLHGGDDLPRLVEADEPVSIVYPEVDEGPPATVLGRVVVSSQCASGMHALYIAKSLLAAGHPEVTVLAVDIASAPAHDNFEALRVLTDEPAPYTERSAGFQLGEGAVAIRVSDGLGGCGVVGPVLGTDLDGDDALERCLGEVLERKMRTLKGLLIPEFADREPRLVIGQGAGPADADRKELAGVASHLPPEVPIATALANAGHTLGASSLLSVAAAACATIMSTGADHFTRTLARRLLVPGEPAETPTRTERAVDIDGRGLGAVQALDARRAEPPPPTALDGRRLRVWPKAIIFRSAAVTRSLGGACGAVIVGDVIEKPVPARTATWGPRSEPPPLRESTLRQIAAQVDAHRPDHPPDLLVVTLDCPLPPVMRVGQRILPTSVLEMTPGFIPQLVARAWGFRGPALCLVGPDPEPLLAALRTTHERVYRLAIRGMHERHVEWIPPG